MTVLLKCAVDERFCIAAVVEAEKKSLRSGKPLQISLQLRKDGDETIIKTKTLPWPTGEELPSELNYDKNDEVLLLRNRTTLARLPFRSRVLQGISEQVADDFTPRSFSSFSIEDNEDLKEETTEILPTIRNALAEEQTKDVNWKKLKKRVKAQIPSLAFLLSHSEQKSLLKLLERKVSNDENVEGILSTLLDALAFGYRVLDAVFVFAEKSSYVTVLDKFLSNSSSFVSSERTFVRILKRISSESDREKGKIFLSKALDLPFDDKSTATAAASILTSTEASTLIEWLTALYEDSTNDVKHGKVLSLLSLLLDSHSTQFLADTATHDSLLRTATLIGGMAALTGTFSELETMSTARKELDPLPQEIPDFRITKVHLVKREWVAQKE